MHKRLTAIGIIFVLLWGLISWISIGLPMAVCQGIDRLSGGHFSAEILKMANGFHYPVNNNDMPTVVFLCIFAVIFFLYLSVVRLFEKTNADRISIWIIIVFAVLMRLILLPSIPIHENDIYRYLWDGKSAVHGINPLKYAPADLYMYEQGFTEDFEDTHHEVVLKAKTYSAEDKIRLDLLMELRNQNRRDYNRIGHWQVPSIYPPTAQGVFFLSTLIKQDSIVFMKFIFILFDLGVILLVILLLKHFKLNPGMSIIYAWSPLVLKEISNSGHYDPVAIFFTLLALNLFCMRKVRVSLFALGLATLAKYYSIILLPFLWRSVKKVDLWMMLAFGVLAFGPFFYWSQTGFHGVFEGLMTYNRQWFYNASLFALLKVTLNKIAPMTVDNLMIPKMIIGCGYLVFLCYLYRREEIGGMGVLRNSMLATAGLFLISPVGDPWYFCWTIPFLCFFPYRSLIYLSGLLMLSYLNFHSDIAWISHRFCNITALTWMIYLPVFLLIALEMIAKTNISGHHQIDSE